MLALGLMALVASVLVGGTAALMRERPATANEVFWKTVMQARGAALKGEHDVRLTFDSKERNFVIDDNGSKTTYPLPGPVDMNVDLLSTQKGTQGLILVGGVAVETSTISAVMFYADGTCTPFRVQFHGSGGANILSIDPWTCAPMLVTPKDTPP